MSTHRRNILLGSLIGAAILPGATLAAATPVAPAPGGIVASPHPEFIWTLPPNEDSKGITIASKPDVTATGKLYDQNLIDRDLLLASDARAWEPNAVLWAGHYWWNVWSTDRSTYASFYSAPAEFTIQPSMYLRGVTTKRHLSQHSLSVVVRLDANVKRPLVRVRLMRGTSVVWKAGKRANGSMIEVVKSSFRWHRPTSIRQGTRLTLVASISSVGVTRSWMRVVRAP